MRKWIAKQLKVFKIKWIMGQCHSICMFCKYKADCYRNLEYEYDK